MIASSGVDSLKSGLDAHYRHINILLESSDEDLAILRKKRPKRNALEEIDYQIERKSYNGKLISPSDLTSRLPVFSQNRNRNGFQHIADKRWRHGIRDNNPAVISLLAYYKAEKEYLENILTVEELDRLERGSFAISPAHIFPAFTDRGESSWTSDKIVRDLSIMNKGFDKISASPLNGKHAITREDAQIAFDYLNQYEHYDLSPTRQVLYILLHRRLNDGFYDTDKFSDIALGI